MEQKKSSSNARGPAWLVVAIVAIATVWGIVLPVASTQPLVKQRIDWLRHERIDPNAMYYTDLEVMQDILSRGELLRSTPRTSSTESPET